MLRINPIKLFTVLLVISIGLGLSVKKFLNSQYLNNYIAQKLLVVSSRNTQFNYKNFNLYVSKSHFVPTLVLQVNEISFFVPDKCRSQTNILAKKVLSPVNILSALWHREEIRLNIELENVLVERKPYQCKGVRVAEEPLQEGISPADSLKQYIEVGIERLPRLDYLSHKLAKRLKVINVNHLQYTDLMGDEKISKLNMNFHDLKIKFAPGMINMSSRADWPYHKVLGKNLQIPVFKFLVQNSKASLKLLGKVREGHISFDAKASKESSLVDIDARARQVPLGESVNLVKNVLGLDLNYTSALSWLNCHLRINGSVEEIFNRPQKINDCQVVGELGEWNLSPYDLKLTSINMQSEPIHLLVKKARIKKVIDFLGIKNQPEKIKKFGLFTGDISWQPIDNSWSTSGVVRNLEIEFEYEKKKIRQLVKSINFKSSGEKKDYSINANKFELQNAKFDGDIDYNYIHNDRVGKIKVDISHLVPGKELKKTLWDTNTQFYQGQFEGVVKGKSYSVKGKLFSKSMENKYLNSGPYEVNLRARDGSVGGNIIFSSINFTDELHKTANLNFERVISKDIFSGLKFYKSHLDFEIDSESLIWKLSNFKSKAMNPNLVFTSFGTINKINMYSQLDFFIPKKAITWAWKGSVEKFKLNLLKSYRGVVRAGIKSPAIKDVIIKSKNKSKPTNIKNKIIEKAKEILPIKGN